MNDNDLATGKREKTKNKNKTKQKKKKKKKNERWQLEEYVPLLYSQQRRIWVFKRFT